MTNDQPGEASGSQPSAQEGIPLPTWVIATDPPVELAMVKGSAP